MRAQQQKSNRQQQQYLQVPGQEDCRLLDSASLENLTASCADVTTSATTDDSESINIEAELRRRNILKQSFHKKSVKQKSSGEVVFKERIFCSTLRPEEGARSPMNDRESGIEKLSTSECSGDLEKELFYLGMRWPTSMRNKSKQAAALSSTSTSATPTQQDPVIFLTKLFCMLCLGYDVSIVPFTMG